MESKLGQDTIQIKLTWRCQKSNKARFIDLKLCHVLGFFINCNNILIKHLQKTQPNGTERAGGLCRLQLMQYFGSSRHYNEIFGLGLYVRQRLGVIQVCVFGKIYLRHTFPSDLTGRDQKQQIYRKLNLYLLRCLQLRACLPDIMNLLPDFCYILI